MSQELIQTEVLIIGCGIAGGVAALQLAEASIPIVVVTRSPRAEECATYFAQGGIVYEGAGDSPEILINDILRAGVGLCNRRSVEILVSQGPALVREILFDRVGVKFDKAADNKFSLAREGGHSLHRILHAADMTGNLIETNLISALRQFPNVTLLTSHTAVDLLTPQHHSENRLSVYEPISAIGAYLLDGETGRIRRCLARNTILATGGLGQIFLRTTNPDGARGDGLAMAYRAGARVINCEFVQFHPTAFFKEGAPCFLISEAVRGAGARLVHSDGSPFMWRFDPQWKDLAPRDVVARAIYQEMLDRNISSVYLDFSPIRDSPLDERFPWVYQQCKKYNVDITKDLVPVVPAAHYACGGVWVDEWGRTTIDNLYAVGEVSCTGVHGANRLASTSLLEGLVWGHRSAQHIRQSAEQAPRHRANDVPPWNETVVEEPDQALIYQDMTVIKHIMWNYVGLIRSKRRLQRALRELRHLEFEVERFYREGQLTDALIGLRNALRSAIIVTIAAWENKKSIGCHFRES